MLLLLKIACLCLAAQASARILKKRETESQDNLGQPLDGYETQIQEQNQNLPAQQQQFSEQISNNPQLYDNNPQLNDNNPQLNDNNPQFNDNNPQFNENNPQFYDNNPQFNDNNPQFENQQPVSSQQQIDGQQQANDQVYSLDNGYPVDQVQTGPGQFQFMKEGSAKAYGVDQNKQDCQNVEKTVFTNKCEPYDERVCITQQEETCFDEVFKNCTAIVQKEDERKCFDVDELICSLQENIFYEDVQETFTVQKCSEVYDKVCDTVYDLRFKTKDDFQCVNVEFRRCFDTVQTIFDKTCRFSVDFQCDKERLSYGYGEVQCKRKPTKNCYDVPRTVSVEMCKPEQRRVCEKLTNQVPFPVERAVCHTEPYKRCELEQRVRPKKAKKYNYTKNCKKVSRQVCENKEVRRLQPECVQDQRKVCKFRPVEKCLDHQKQYCYKVAKTVVEKVCSKSKYVPVSETEYNV